MMPPPPNRIPARPIVRTPWREHFGLNLRAEGAGLAAADGGKAGMGGLGLSMRWRPAPAFALDAGLDVLGGSDYYSNSRIETAVSLSGMVFFNPKSILQVYMLGGFHISHAEISQNQTVLDNSTFWNDGSSRDYFGIHGGLGLEWRIAKHVGLDLDALAPSSHRHRRQHARVREPEDRSNVRHVGRRHGPRGRHVLVVSNCLLIHVASHVKSAIHPADE